MKQTKEKTSKKTPKKPKNIKKAKKSNHQQEDEEFESNQLDSLSNIYDSDEESVTESFEEEGEQEQFDDISEDDGDSLDDFEKEIEKQCKDSKPSKSIQHNQESKNQSAHLNSIVQEQKPTIDPIEEEKKRKLEEIQRLRIEKYLKKPIKNTNQNNQLSETASRIKLENDQKLSVVPQPSQNSHWNEQSDARSQVNSTIAPKTQRSEAISNKSNKSDPDLINYLVKLMSGKLTPQQIEERRLKDQKRQKIEEKIKEIHKRKMQDKIKKEYDERSMSQMKLQSTNMDSIYDKEEDSFRMPLKSEDGRSTRGKLQGANGDPEERKKRTRVTTEMLKEIIKEFEVMARQQSGHLPKNGVRITFREIGRKFGLGRSSVMKMYSDYCKDPTMKSRFDSKQPATNSRTIMELTKRRINFVEKLVKEDCTLSQRQIAAVMNQHEDLKCKRKKRDDETQEEYEKNPYHEIAYKAVSRLMKLAKFTRKKVTLIPKNRNSDRTLQERYNFCKVLNELRADDNNKLYFLDECRFNLFTSRDWGWAPKGQLATKVRHNSKGKDIMLLAIIGINGLIGYEVSDSYIRGSFTIAVTKMINSIIPEVVPENEKIYLILDNCPIHNKQCLKEMQERRPITVLYLPPYSPMLNPIETWFGQLKRIVKSKIYKTRQAMKTELIRVLETYRNKSMANYYRGTEKYIQLGLQKKLFRGNNKF